MVDAAARRARRLRTSFSPARENFRRALSTTRPHRPICLGNLPGRDDLQRRLGIFARGRNGRSAGRDGAGRARSAAAKPSAAHPARPASSTASRPWRDAIRDPAGAARSEADRWGLNKPSLYAGAVSWTADFDKVIAVNRRRQALASTYRRTTRSAFLRVELMRSALRWSVPSDQALANSGVLP